MTKTIDIEPKSKEERKFDVCQFCEEVAVRLPGPSDPRPYVCLKHRHLAYKVWPQMYG